MRQLPNYGSDRERLVICLDLLNSAIQLAEMMLAELGAATQTPEPANADVEVAPDEVEVVPDEAEVTTDVEVAPDEVDTDYDVHHG